MFPTPVSPAPPPRRGWHDYRLFLFKLVTTTVAVPLILSLSLAGMLITVAAVVSSGPSAEPVPFAGAEHLGGDETAADWVLVVPVDGPIMSSGGGFGASGGAELLEILEEAADAPQVRAVVLEMSTPGGTIPGSIDVAAGVAAVRAAGKPVVAYVADMSASGGVWAMAGADHIVAHPGSVVGSVGVLFGPLRSYQGVTGVDDGVFGGGVTAESVTEFYVTAGTSKDLGNPFRPMTDAEYADLQAQVDSVYEDFVAHVTRHRKGVSEVDLRERLGAKLFRAEDARAAGMVDEVGSRREAWDRAASLAGVEVFDVRRPEMSGSLLGALLGASRLGAPDAGAVSAAAGAAPGPLSLCSPTAQVFAFHGDLAAWCRRLSP